MTKLIEATIRVRDLERSRHFYQLLGAPCGDVGADRPGESKHVHATWGKWSAHSDDFLMLNILPTTDGVSMPVEIGFSVEDLDKVHGALVTAGVDVIRSPEAQPWGRMATYRDPDGNTVSLTQLPRE